MSRNSDPGTTALVYGVGVPVILAVSTGINALVGAAVNGNYGAEKAQEYAEQSGYSSVQVTDTDIVLVGLRAGCSGRDAVGYEMKATAPNGAKNVGIVVCKGAFKGATLRQA